MADAKDPGRMEERAKREKERVRKQVREPNRSDILKTIRKGQRGDIPSPKPNKHYKDAWAWGSVKRNASKLRILADEVEGLEEAEDEKNWNVTEGRDDYPDRLLDHDDEQARDLVADIAMQRGHAETTERDYCLVFRNLFLAHDQIETAKSIPYPQPNATDDAAVDMDSVPTRDELFALIEGESARDRALLATMWESGNRVCAMAALKIKHFTPKGDSYGILRLPSQFIGAKGAEDDVKPLTFSRGYLDTWLSMHDAGDDPDAALFCSSRDRDDPREHVTPHSIRQQIKRIARRTDGVDVENISPHMFKHGRGTEMRASEKYDKDDIEQIMDWEEGTDDAQSVRTRDGV